MDSHRHTETAEKFNEAAKYVDTTQDDRTILSKLAAAKSRYEHGDYQEAAMQFYTAFKELYPN